MQIESNTFVHVYCGVNRASVLKNKMPGPHENMSQAEIKEWNAILAAEADEDEQRMLDYD